ncbi:group 1 glycosyl transferase [Halorubrum ezzemoulense]|uniref:Group 1 glycosyl transferase n=1 Tax=Halorubrum ezzemoulense TaxID=337243 RepID=A0A256JLE2_HALEZ|nr:glycosyltransferase family 4 protein [Halorubrum ezzemoulense]OYR69590.1 group 1 glycosyl transferase [Halorubrum ezzemoulense]
MTTDILYIVSRLRPSGPTNQLYYILKHLNDEFDATILTLSPEPEDTELPLFQDLGVNYETLGLSRWEGLLFGPWRLRRKVQEIDPDIVQTQGIRADTLSALFLKGYPRITTVRNYPYDDYPAKFGTLQGKAMAAEHIRVYRRIDHPVACSETIADMVRPHGVDATPIQNGVDTEAYSPVSDEEKRRLRKPLDIPESAMVFVSVGTLIPRKNPLDVIEGFQNADIENGMLLLLGDGPLQEECKSLAAGDDRVRLEGWVDNVSEYLGASDFFVSASSSEGLPNTVMEALSCGLPVILSDIQPHREILQYNAEAGTVFDLGDTRSLSEVLSEILNEEYSVVTAAARTLVVRNLSAKRMCEQYQDQYRKITIPKENVTQKEYHMYGAREE